MNVIYVYAFLAVFFLGIPLVRGLINIYPEYLWHLDLGYQNAFLKMLLSKWVVFIALGLIAALIIFINIKLALMIRKKLVNEPEIVSEDNRKFDLFSQFNVFTAVGAFKTFAWMPVLISVVIGLTVSSVWFIQWDKLLLYFNQQPFGTSDPIFHKDISFYFFSYPFLLIVKSWLFGIVISSMIAVGVIYAHYKTFFLNGFKIRLHPGVRIHASFLFACLFGLIAWGYQLGMYEMLFSPSGIVYGAGYTDVYADLIGLKCLFVIALVVAALFLYNMVKQAVVLPIVAFFVLIGVYVVMRGFYPALMSQFIVKPNEIEKERPFIQYNIDYTRKAYGLDKIFEREIGIAETLTEKDIKNNTETIDNVRLWDTRPLLKTLSQLQEIRLYHDFNDVDIDCYWINGKYQQVMLSARELDADKLPVRAQNWINQKLTYTHGYGLVMMPVNKISREGLPEFYVYDIPHKSNIDLKLNNLSIYFGESTNKYIITNTSAKEFDYPAGESNQYSVYNGDKGIALDSIWKKLVFAIKFNEFKILISEYIKPTSKVLFDRNIMTRVKKIAPFLVYDKDPYSVVVDGQLYWFLDAYTISDRYPYSDPFYGGYNYIRNSVKVIINAYTGKTDFYIVDNEPIIKAYSKIFPGLFKADTELSKEFTAHFRYPVDLFSVQSKMYSSYHMTDPQIFYNQEDLWVIPNETYEGEAAPVEPYYINMRLPEDNVLTFRLMLPFSPAKKNNMIGWMSANCDPENYGKITVYKLPKEQLIYGPTQIESRIDQDTDISQQLTLWGQLGSRVIRGNLLVIPISNSFLYVEPIYLQATQSKFPELKRVIVAYKNSLAMETSFEEALAKVLSLEIPTISPKLLTNDKEKTKQVSTIKELISKAKGYYNKAEQSIKQGDWKAYGDNIKNLGNTIEELEKSK
ncbi:MAG: UPF0182 family protein [Candidatus Riflemargulisbacteria bacterium]